MKIKNIESANFWNPEKNKKLLKIQKNIKSTFHSTLYIELNTIKINGVSPEKRVISC